MPHLAGESQESHIMREKEMLVLKLAPDDGQIAVETSTKFGQLIPRNIDKIAATKL